ncbi:MAG: hypothetical protein ACOYEG_12115 [Petrimonas sp.]|jgi:hypothetical protein
MLPSEINNYLNKRYDRYLDYAEYHCNCAGIPDEAQDILNEVLLNVLEKPKEKIINLYNKKKDCYRDLDFFILRMIKLNATSATSPYRWKLNKFTPPIDKNSELTKLEIEDKVEEEKDLIQYILDKKRIVHDIVDNRLNISDKKRALFYFRFEGGKVSESSDLTGIEVKGKAVYEAYYEVRNMIKEEIEKDKIRKTAAALLRTVEAEVKIIKSNIELKNSQIIERKKQNIQNTI